MNDLPKQIGIALLVLGVGVASSIIGSAIYSNASIKPDYKAIAIYGGLGLAAAFLAVKLHKGSVSIN